MWNINITNRSIANFLGFTERAIYKYKKYNKENEKENKDSKNIDKKSKKYNIYASGKLAVFLKNNKNNLKRIKYDLNNLSSIVNFCCQNGKAKNDAEKNIKNILEFIENLENLMDFKE